MLDELGISTSQLPEYRESGEVVGKICKGIAAEMG